MASAELKHQNQWLLVQLGLAKKRQFGSFSEKMQEGLMGQLSLNFKELEAHAYAPIFYYLGNGYGILADYQHKSGGIESEVIKFRKQWLYYMRKALSLLEGFDDNSLLINAAVVNGLVVGCDTAFVLLESG